MSENLIEYFISCLEKNPADIVTCDFFSILEYQLLTPHTIAQSSPKEKIELLSNVKYLQKMYSSNDHICTNCAVVWNKLINRTWLLSTQYHAIKDKVNISYNFLTKKSKILVTNQILICDVIYDKFLKDNSLDLNDLNALEFLETLLIKYKKQKLTTATFNTAERLLKFLLKLRKQTTFFALRIKDKDELKQTLNKKFNSIYQFLKIKYPDKEKRYSPIYKDYLTLLKDEKFREKYYYLYPDYLIRYEKPIFPHQYWEDGYFIPIEGDDDTEYETIEYF